MRLPKWLVPILAIALMATAGGWFLAKDAPAPDAAPAFDNSIAAAGSASSAEEKPSRSIHLEAEGTWLDLPPEAAVPPVQSQAPPRYPPYDAGADPYRDGRWAMYPGQRDLDRPRRTGWLESFCPLPKPQRSWPTQSRYPRQLEPLNPWEYADPFVSQPPVRLTAPMGR
jgi:hypothetical protein